MQNYDNYFKNRYKYEFSEKNILNYKKWFMAQWRFVHKLIPNKKLRILEIGSGIGGIYQFIRDDVKDYEYTGLELDTDAVNFSNTFFKTNNFILTSFEEFESTQRFDLILSFEVLEHLENPSLAIRKIHSLLSEDGIFMGTTPYPFKKNILGDKTHLFVLHPENWKRLFVYSNFQKVITKNWSFLPVVWRFFPKLNFIYGFKNFFPKVPSTTFIYAKK